MPYLSAMTRTSMEALAFPEVSMLKRRDVPFVTVIGLLPFVLAACNDATSSTPLLSFEWVSLWTFWQDGGLTEEVETP